jgi:hypothetical protein
MTHHRFATLALVFASACSGTADTPQEPLVESLHPWFVGVFSGRSVLDYVDGRIEADSGQFELKPEGTFSVHFRSAASNYAPSEDWRASGSWELTGSGKAADSEPVTADIALCATLVNGLLYGVSGEARVTGEEVLVDFGWDAGFVLTRQ